MKMLLYFGWRGYIPCQELRREQFRAKFAPVTVFMEHVPRLEDMSFDIEKPVALTYGFAICDWRDDFSKKVGRKLATESAKPMLFKVNTILIEGDGSTWSLTSEDRRHCLALEYVKGRQSPLVDLMYCNRFYPVMAL